VISVPRRMRVVIAVHAARGHPPIKDRLVRPLEMEEVIGGPQHVEAILLGALCLLIPVGVRLREAGESEAQHRRHSETSLGKRGAKCDATEKARLLATDQVARRSL